MYYFYDYTVIPCTAHVSFPVQDLIGVRIQHFYIQILLELICTIFL